MGKGDQRSKRGKIFRGTFGKTRPRKPHKAAEAVRAAAAAPAAPAKPAVTKKRAPAPAE